MLSKERKKWRFKASNVDESIVGELAKALGISKVLAMLIATRGYTDVDSAREFISKSTEIMHNPFLLNDMEKGALRIIKAIDNGERISIYGDYDVDGVTSVSILYMYLSELGAHVDYYIPSRMGEGYGVSKGAIARLAENGTNLIITVDTGVTALEEVEQARDLGVDVVITDHHECHSTLPRAVAVINPKRHDSQYPFSHLAGVGVVFKLLCAMECLRTGEEMIDCVRRISLRYADLTAIGTIADVMPVKDENRLMVSLGLSLIETTNNIGLRAIVELCRTNETKTKVKAKKKISSGFVGFTIAPRINAAGRISEASIAVELFLSKDEKKAQEYALRLCDINKDRQFEENKIAEQAYDKIEGLGEIPSGVIILEDPKWHHGVIGIVASRISERYSLPTILISFEGNEDPEDPEAIGKGSGRSIDGLNLVDALSYCRDLLEKFGGHELAAGLTVKRKNIDALRLKINEYAMRCFEENQPENIMDIECELDSRSANIEIASELNLLEPYGVSNPIPVFSMSGMIIEDIIPIGMNRHLKLTLSKDGRLFTSMLFCVSSQEFPYETGDEVDVAFNLEINEFRNEKNVQLNIRDIRLSETIYQEQIYLQDQFLLAESGESNLSADQIIPQRDEFALVYSFLLKESREGREKYSYIKLLDLLKRKYSNVTVNYIKLKFIVKIFKEMNIISIEETDEFSFVYRMNFSKTKTDLEASTILKKLRLIYSTR